MLRITAVAIKENDDDCKISSETGIFVAHSHTQTCSKYIISMYLNNYTTTLLTICIMSLCFTQQCLAANTTTIELSSNNFDVYKPPPLGPHECGSVDLRNDCDSFHRLDNCTAVTGFLSMSLLRHPGCNISEYKFVHLREITDFLIISDVRNLTSLKNVFPNLTVIRGRRLLINYALIMSNIEDLERVEFKSLIALQRGHVLLDNCPKVCNTEKINWARLALRRGRNNIFAHKKANCSKEAMCSGCSRDACWSDDVCQKFDNDSVLSPIQDIEECHKECLGGCYNNTAQGCAVCKGYTDHGTCVSNCPNDKYASSHYLRCYTREECLNKRLFIYNNTCVDSCPVGHKLNITTWECDHCEDSENCLKVCDSESPFHNNIYIPDISHAEYLKGCQILNASVIIDIYEFFDQQELRDSLKDVIEITGFLKINRSPFLISLDFFQNLEKIHGLELEHDQYALIIYNNKNLTELWYVKPEFEILNGGMYIHANNKLCNHRIKQFRQSIKHDNSLDSYQTSDQEVLCAPSKLNMNTKVLGPRSIELIWFKDRTLPEVEIMYRPISYREQLAEKSEIDTEVCNRKNWHRELKFASELEENGPHYLYIIKNLEPYTRYAILVKAFNGQDDVQGVRSEIQYVNTDYDIPAAPNIFVKSKTFDTLYIEFSPSSAKHALSQLVDYYLLEVYEVPDDKTLLDTRNYCDEPIMGFKDISHDDYDDCCSWRQRNKKDQHFLSQLNEEFSCSSDQIMYCTPNLKEDNDHSKKKAILKKRFESYQHNYTIRSLERFHLYILQIRACSHLGCSSYTILSARTNYSMEADRVYDFYFCRQSNSTEYRVQFLEPKRPNGYITSYAIHFRNNSFDNKEITFDQNELACVTRLEHEKNNYVYVAHYNQTFNQAAVRVHSLGYVFFVNWVNVTDCIASPKVAGTKFYFILSFIAAIVAGPTGWICHKRRCVPRMMQALRRRFPFHTGWRSIGPTLYVNADYPPESEELIELQDRNLPP